VTSTHTITIESIRNNFNRVDLYFRNPNFANANNFVVTITNQFGTQISQQNFSGFNAGDPSSIRLDIPVQPDSKDQIYTLTIAPAGGPVAPDPINLRIGVTDAENTLALKSYYLHPTGFTVLLRESFDAYLNVVKQIPWLYAIMAVLLFLAL
jgi:hypothetical protein